MSTRFVLGNTALREMPEQDYEARALVRELESSIRCAWRTLQQYRRRARELSSDPIAIKTAREGAFTLRFTLKTLLNVRREGRLR